MYDHQEEPSNNLKPGTYNISEERSFVLRLTLGFLIVILLIFLLFPQLLLVEIESRSLLFRAIIITDIISLIISIFVSMLGRYQLGIIVTIVASQITVSYYLIEFNGEGEAPFLGAYFLVPLCLAHFYLTRRIGLIVLTTNALFLAILPIINHSKYTYQEFSIPLFLFIITIYGTIFLSSNSSDLLLGQRYDVRTNYPLDVNPYENSLKLKVIFFETNDIIIITNDTGTIESVNPSINQQFGYFPEELLGQNVKILMPIQDEDDHDRYIKNYLKTNQKKIIGIGREVLAKKKNDHVFPIHLSVSEVDLGTERKFIGVMRDISDIQNAQKLLEKYAIKLESELDDKSKLYVNLFHNSKDAIFILDENGYIKECNQSMVDLLYPEQMDLSEIDIKKINIDMFFESKIILDIFKEKLSIHGFVKDFEFQMLIDEHRVLSCIMSANTIESGTVDFGGFLAILRDVTQSKILDNHIHQQQKFELVSRLSGGFAHDFNNRLTLITGYSEFLLSEDLKPKVKEGLEEINKTCIKASQLVFQLLSYSKPDIKSDKQNVNLSHLINELKEILSKTLPSNIVLEYELDPLIQPIKADPIQIEQILLNLIFNAIDAMLLGGTLTITTKIIEAEIIGKMRRNVVLIVRDTGTGIDDEIKSKIFKPYFTTKSEEKGTGLGLSMVNELVIENEGTVEFESEIGESTTFKITFPVVEDDLIAYTPIVQKEKLIPKNLGILIVDDNKDIMTILEKHYMSKTGSTFGFQNALETLKLIKDQHQIVDVAIIDIAIPYIGGIELARRIRDYNPKIKSILISGYFNDEKLNKIIEQEGFHLINKPISLAELDQTIIDLFTEEYKQ